MSLIKIPDGDRRPIYFESKKIAAVRESGTENTYIWIIGIDEPFTVNCDIETVLTLIPER